MKENQNEPALDKELNEWHLHLERIMAHLDKDSTPKEHKKYLAGYIDALYDLKLISEDCFDILMPIYGPDGSD